MKVSVLYYPIKVHSFQLHDTKENFVSINSDPIFWGWNSFFSLWNGNPELGTTLEHIYQLAYLISGPINLINMGCMIWTRTSAIASKTTRSTNVTITNHQKSETLMPKESHQLCSSTHWSPQHKSYISNRRSTRSHPDPSDIKPLKKLKMPTLSQKCISQQIREDQGLGPV